MLNVVATLLIRRAWDLNYLNNWKPTDESQSHPGDLGNLLTLKCYTKESVWEEIDALNNLPAIEEIIVVYGDSNWHEYAAENGIELKIYDCPWCYFEGGSDIIGPVYYYTGE